MSENGSIATNKEDNKTANFNKTFTDISDKQLFHLLQLEYFGAVKKNLCHCLKTGDKLALKIQVECTPISIISGSYTIDDLNMPKEVTDAKTLELVEKAFALEDSTKEARKIRYKKALEELSN